MWAKGGIGSMGNPLTNRDRPEQKVVDTYCSDSPTERMCTPDGVAVSP